MSIYPEPLVARSLGVKKNVLADTRRARLARGTDWLLAGAVVTYTRDGLKKLCGALGLDSSRVPAPAAAGDPTAGQPDEGRKEATARQGEATLTSADQGGGHNGHEIKISSSERPAPASAIATAAQVAAGVEDLAKKSEPVLIQVTGISPNLIIVHGRLEDRTVTVRVRANTNFVPGLWIRATPINGGSYYSMIGHPPRWKGDRHGFTKPSNS